MARPRWAALAVLATITLASCTAGGKAKTTASGQVGDTSAAKSFDDLSKALDITVPDGYRLQPDKVGDTGPSDLEKAVSDDGDDDAREVFTRDGFRRGYQRLWSRTQDDEIVAYVYQFTDYAGALDYTKRVTADSGAQTGDVSMGLFNVPGIEGAVGVNRSDPNFATSTVTFAKGPYSVQVVVNGATSDGLQALVSALAEEQYSRL